MLKIQQEKDAVREDTPGKAAGELKETLASVPNGSLPRCQVEPRKRHLYRLGKHDDIEEFDFIACPCKIRIARGIAEEQMVG